MFILLENKFMIILLDFRKVFYDSFSNILFFRNITNATAGCNGIAHPIWVAFEFFLSFFPLTPLQLGLCIGYGKSEFKGNHPLKKDYKI